MADQKPIDLSALTLAELLWLEDGIDSIKRGWSKDAHIMIYKPTNALCAESGYDQAKQFIEQCGTTAKPEKAVHKAIKAKE